MSTNRDDWVYDFDKETLEQKVKFFISTYEDEKKRWRSSKQNESVGDFVDRAIKWTVNLESHLRKGSEATYESKKIIDSLYRPFVSNKYYADEVLSDRFTSNHFEILGPELPQKNPIIAFRYGNRLEFSALATYYLPNLNLYSADPAQNLPLYRYDKHGNRLDNITDWGLKGFREHYGKVALPRGKSPLARLVKGEKEAGLDGEGGVAKPPFGKGGWGDSTGDVEEREIERVDIFHYTYGVLHNPAYRKKYELNLKREFPHIPFYDDFAQWAAWGAHLMDLHLNYEGQEPYDLMRVDAAGVKNPKAKLKADKEAGQIVLDTQTVLSNVPPEAWEYKLGNRSALEWVLDRYKEKKPKDPTIREKFNTYRFADYKEEVIDLLKRVCTVSVATVQIVRMMEGAERNSAEREVKHDDGAA